MLHKFKIFLAIALFSVTAIFAEEAQDQTAVVEEEFSLLEQELAQEELTQEEPKIEIEEIVQEESSAKQQLQTSPALPERLADKANEEKDLLPLPLKEEKKETAALEMPKEQSADAFFLTQNQTTKKVSPPAFQVNFIQVFSGAPIIYTLLLVMSVGAIFIWLYNFLILRDAASLPETLVKHVRNKLTSNSYEEALVLCLQNDNVFCKMLASGIATRAHGLHIMLQTMKSEGQRATVAFWQRLALLNDIAIIAPMLGLLGTVIGMFYAFYDINRSVESVSTFFDGLGISVGTTVAGLLVAILALILHSIGKYRLVRHLAHIENEAQSFAALIESKASIIK